MRQIRVLLSIAGLAALSACAGCNNLGSNSLGSKNLRSSDRTVGVGPNTASPVAAHSAAGSIAPKETPAATIRPVAKITSASPADKLIALTFDDGPRPYVLFGSKAVHPAPGLVDILDQNGVKATFFVVGWRLTPKTWGEPKHEEDIGVSCLDAAAQLIRRGHELEDHTYSHLELRSAEKKNGELWVMHDVDRGAQAIKAVTGTQPRYVRPPDWIITTDARRDLQQQGYNVLTISSENPIALRDVNSLDYLCAGKAVGCPKPSLPDAVLQQVEQREKKGTYTHILAFHELSTTAAIMPRLISDLKARGYRFVTLTEYMKLVGSKPGETVKQQAAITKLSRLVLSR
ncbi:MAG TPA: polysaccharide deacetylase family protein [Candidatus Angelobacter sp.]|jgi:peptidoglycan/xylan/chitin deacetylase (PgdA/CDA1 family)